jgi:hypothetical protein
MDVPGAGVIPAEEQGQSPQALRFGVGPQSVHALGQDQGLARALPLQTGVGGGYGPAALLFQIEQQRQIRAAAAAIRALLDIGSANGTAHQASSR